jgi:hypothetical protein
MGIQKLMWLTSARGAKIADTIPLRSPKPLLFFVSGWVKIPKFIVSPLC